MYSRLELIMLPFNQLIHGDSIETLAQMPKNSVDLIFADPPYNLQLKQELWRPNLTKVDAVDDNWDQFESFAAYDAFTETWLKACRRVMKPTATIWISGTYHNIFRIGATLQDLGFWVLNTVAWFKTNAMPNFRGTRLKNDIEFIIWAKYSEKSRYTFNHHLMKQFNDFSPDKQLGSVWKIPACGGQERLKDAAGNKLHSTQKPEELLKRIILASSKPDDLVLDPFVGTGTTAAVAKLLRRRWVGIERDEQYYQAACQRLEAVQPLPLEDALIQDGLQKKRVRVPFKQLLDLGYLQAGQKLYLDKSEHTARILGDGKLQVNGTSGSIHRLGATLKNAPSCNGWQHWYFEAEDGQLHVIDELRQRVRAQQDR